MNKPNHTAIIFLMVLFIFSAFAVKSISAQTPDLRPLTTGQVIERELKGDESHSYSLALKVGQYLDLVVEQKGIDVIVALFDADGKKIIEVDSPNGTQGAEPLAVIIETAGNYRLEIRSLEKTAAAGQYEVKINELRTATEKDRNWIAANKLFNEAEELRQGETAESLQNAIKLYEKSLLLIKPIGNREREALTLNNLGFVYVRLGDLQQGLKYINMSLQIYQAIGDKRGQAASLSNLGTIYSTLGDKQKALNFFREAIPLQIAIGDKSSQANTLAGIGNLFSALGDIQQALKYLNEALQISRENKDKSGQATALNNIGLIYRNLGEKQQALEKFTESLAFFREVNDKPSESTALNNISLVYSDLGEKQKALKFYKESLEISRRIGDKDGETATLNNIGLIHSYSGEWQLALKYYNESLEVTRQIGNKYGQATLLSNIGKVFLDLGDRTQALKVYEDSLVIFREIKDKRGEALTLTSIGAIYIKLGKAQLALEYYTKSLSLSKEIGDKGGQAVTLNNIGAVYDYLGNTQQALKYYSESLPLRHLIEDKRGEAQTLNNIGKSYNDLGDNKKALEYLSKSLILARSANDLPQEVITLGNLFISISPTNLRFRTLIGKQTINNYQILRSNVAELDKNIQKIYLKTIENGYRRLADELIKQNRYAEAQQVLNSFKDQQFFDFNQNKQFAPLAVTTREAEFTATFNQKIETVVAAIRALDEYKRGIGTRPPTADETAQIKSLEDKKTAANDDYLAFLKSAEKEFAAPPDEKDKTPVVNDLTEMQTTLRELSAQTGEKSVAVYTLVGVDNYRALVVTSDSIFAVSTPIKGDLLNYKAQQLWAALKTPKYDPQPLAKEVYDVVFAPLAAKLPADTKTILWSLDGSLRYLPMAALHDGKKYLVERYNNIVFTRADGERLTRNVSANLTGTGFGTSLRYNVKLDDKVFKLPDLSSVITEMEGIFKYKNSLTGILPGEVLLDMQFTRSAMISTLQKRRPLVHIASHFIFKPGDEAKSFLLLGDGSPFTLDEMKQQKNLFAGVELLTLSACDTAAQQEDSNGREIDGFAELAQRLGAGAVMASLWSVEDNSTAALMARFYKIYDGKNGANKADALRTAQLALLRGEYKTADATTLRTTREDSETADRIKLDTANLKLFKRNQNSRFAHPFYWSPFILIGNWK